MARWYLRVEYDGGGYVGWQRQKSGASIQQALEDAIFRFSGETVNVQGAGRTDAGVHALSQAAHFDLRREATADTVRDAINAHLRPQLISVLSASRVTEEFHARFSAKSRSYSYRILNRRSPPAVDAGRVWHVQKPLDAEAMGEAAKVLVGEHDFTTFRASICQANSPIKTLWCLTVSRERDLIIFNAKAPSFLHHQIRNLVGTLRLVGEGKWTSSDISDALEARDRARGGETAPAAGLFLTGVDYPVELMG
jgi:tRNA pseudouridine38-40 synthase